MSATKLWDKWFSVDEMMQQLTVWNDNILDNYIAQEDVIWNAAHAKMLEKSWYLTTEELKNILVELKNIFWEIQKWDYKIGSEFEDIHSAVEAKLTEKLWDTWKKIHTWRSRNDQVLLDMQLFLRKSLFETLKNIQTTLKEFEEKIASDWSIKMPWYTHLQRAMPSSVSLWLWAFYEQMISLLEKWNYLLEEVNKSPLWWAAGFWVSLNTDPNYTATLLGFRRAVYNPIYMNNTRGLFELRILDFYAEIAGMFQKFSIDIMFGQTTEFWFFWLPKEFTTGSSIMPQKKNLDIVELLRGRTAKIYAKKVEIEWIIGKMPSSYHRDFQFTKEPFIEAQKEMKNIFDSVYIIIKNLIFNKDKLELALSDEMYTTYAAFQYSADGVPFRDAYKSIAKELELGTFDAKKYHSHFQKIQDDWEKNYWKLQSEKQELSSQIAKKEQNIEEKIKCIFDV